MINKIKILLRTIKLLTNQIKMINQSFNLLVEVNVMKISYHLKKDKIIANNLKVD